ncbi:MAG: 1-acyl-sn-glycerol-3-phosphate acyltransferase [Proteobacteria bacterium]|nr:1-acyl-sn-glycerol-3-phosphate acyltransferase [Pseudomonadota bacterium]MBU1715594.1 1-acyl-sn-glycerol-3-phosphate acyltransferase [Pseudomonadota bacterium]
MKIFSFVRALVTFLSAFILTFIVSVAAIIGGVILRMSAKSIQVIPRMWARSLACIGGVKVTVEGGESLEPDKPYIFVVNHQSQFDIFALQGYANFDFRWLAKKELFKVPLFGAGMLQAGYIPIDRSHGRQAVKSLDAAARRISGGASVVVFPEGTRSPDGKLKPFKVGAMVLAIKAGVPLVPVAIIGSYEILPKGKLLPRSGRILIRVGEPISIAGYDLKQKKELAERMQEEVARLLAQ